MAMNKSELIEWLNTLDDDDDVGISDGGLSLVVVGDEGCYLEVGGVPLDGDEDEDED